MLFIKFSYFFKNRSQFITFQKIKLNLRLLTKRETF